MVAVVLFVFLAVAIIALPPLIATICFDHIRSDSTPELITPLRFTRHRRWKQPHTQRFARFGKRM